MSKKLVWWQAYKAALAGGRDTFQAREMAHTAVKEYIAATALYGKEMAS